MWEGRASMQDDIGIILGLYFAPYWPLYQKNSARARGVATKFCLGGGGDGSIDTQTNLPPKFSFFSDFRHFILKMVENVKWSYVSSKKMLQYHNFWRGRPPLIFFYCGGRAAVKKKMSGGRPLQKL